MEQFVRNVSVIIFSILLLISQSAYLFGLAMNRIAKGVMIIIQSNVVYVNLDTIIKIHIVFQSVTQDFFK